MENLLGELKTNYPLSRHTSWRVGGKADCCYRPLNIKDLSDFLQQLPMDSPLTWLGLGSNVLIRDGGIKGAVILTLNGLNEIEWIEKTHVRAEAGVTCAKLAKFCVKKGFEGGAFFAGIPGTVGGALTMNAGAFGGETWESVEMLETMDRQGVIRIRKPHEFNIAYRHVDRPLDEYFVAGFFRFQQGDVDKAKQQLKALLKKRNDTQPIGTFSCGSVFRNPKGDYAARLIENTGLKGYRLGNVAVSDKHANFILNHGKASAADIEKLIYFIMEEVRKQEGVKLLPEVHIIGRSID